MTSAAAATEWYILKQVVPLSRAQNTACKMLARVAAQVDLLVVCAGYQKLDSLQDLDFDDLDKHWQVKHLPIPYLLKSQTIHPLLKQQCLDRQAQQAAALSRHCLRVTRRTQHDGHLPLRCAADQHGWPPKGCQVCTAFAEAWALQGDLV